MSQYVDAWGNPLPEIQAATPPEPLWLDFLGSLSAAPGPATTPDGSTMDTYVITPTGQAIVQGGDIGAYMVILAGIVGLLIYRYVK